MMKFGFFTDKGLDKQNLSGDPWNKLDWHPDINSYGYRCREWDPMPEGKKNVVVLGCSHTFGQGLRPGHHWVSIISQHNEYQLRYWNLGVPGASGECCVRRLWGSQKLIDPRIVIVCWPDISRRAWYGNNKPGSILGKDEQNRYQTDDTDLKTFLHNVFWVQKYGEINNAKIFHCFATEYVEHRDLEGLNVLREQTIKNCWPHWDKFTQRELYVSPSLALDNKHYGKEHHKRFAKLFLEQFGQKLR